MDLRQIFQYQKGAIKTGLDAVLKIITIAFQYQKGAIKTEVARHIPVRVTCFQYQKGAIKTRAGPTGEPNPDSPFNTKKVRLKLRKCAAGCIPSSALSIPKRCD